MPLTLDNALHLQLKMAKKVINHDILGYNEIRYICGVDVSYRNDKAFACAVVVDKYDFTVINSSHSITTVENPYLSGLLFLRESGPIFRVLKKLDQHYEVLMVDGHGISHPRMFGLASYVGTKVNKPTIGVAKTLLCGNISKNGSQAILSNGKVVGQVINTSSKPIYVSIGHMVSLATAVKLVKEVSKYRIPEPIRQADINSRKMSKY